MHNSPKVGEHWIFNNDINDIFYIVLVQRIHINQRNVSGMVVKSNSLACPIGFVCHTWSIIDNPQWWKRIDITRTIHLHIYDELERILKE